MDENVAEAVENDTGHSVDTLEKFQEDKVEPITGEDQASKSYQHELKNDASGELSGEADLNCNVNVIEKQTNLNEPIKGEDKLELAVKQSDITFLDGDTVPASTELQYKSATEVYEKTGTEETLLSESVILNTTGDGTIVIVTNAEQHSPNNIIVYETNAGYVETHLATSENPVGNETSEAQASQIAEVSEQLAEQETAEVNTVVQIDAVSEPATELENVEQTEGAAPQTTEPIETNDSLEQVDNTNEQTESNHSNQVDVKTAESDPGHAENVVDEAVAGVENVADEAVTEVIPRVDNQGNDERVEAGEIQEVKETGDAEKQAVENEQSETNEQSVCNAEPVGETGQDEIVLQPEENHTNQYETVEQQVCAIVKQDDAESSTAPVKSISIVEAITRDFDETDSEDAESANLTTALTKSEDKVNVENCPEQHMYIVESTEELLVLESEPLDEPDTIEVTVVNENVPQKPPSKPGKEKVSSRLLQIPSHVLGRNITNPADDPFRNGKVPPKPRLGVKIPYRNLTSQIVSKEEIAQEILERQRNKYSDFSQPQGDVLFAKKLTQRLARKIAPPQPAQEEPQTAEAIAAEKINNSDLIAILEGDGDDASENKKLGASNVDPQISKILERQIALKQLNELPRGRGRLRRMNLEKVAVNRLKAQVAEKVCQVDKVPTKVSENSDGKTRNLKTETEAASEKADNPETALNENVKKEIQSEQVKSDCDIKLIRNIEDSVHEILHEEGDVIAKKSKGAPTKTTEGDENVKKQEAKSVKPTPNLTDASNLSNNDKSKKTEAKLAPKESTKSEKSNPEVKSKDALRDFPMERKFSSTAPIKTYTRKRKSSEEIQPPAGLPEKRAVVVQRNLVPTYVTKSSRIIKRKVIWDPDEPSTTRSVTLRSPKPVESPVKIESPSKKPSHKKSPLKSPDKFKKRLTEVDRLLMDEGAVNMLYAFKNTDDAVKKKKATVISLDRAQRELLNKTNEIKRDLTSGSDKISPKSLRKKDSPINILSSQKKSVSPALVTRKKSKDSSQGSVTSRPGSPGLIYHPHHAEASRIIRRHSSSSYSSIEGEEKANEESEEVASVAVATSEPEKIGKRKSTTLEAVKVKKVKHIDKDNEPLSVIAEKIKAGQEKLIEVEEVVEDVYSKYKTFCVKRIDLLVQIVLLPSVNDQVYFTPEILQELTSILKELQQDDECHVVLVSSSASSFCQGINYKTLACDKEQTRKLIAKKLAACISTFLKTLSAFTKIIIAGVHGDAVGLGVTMLPLFDMVIASDTATFSIPNARLGCAVEGSSLLSLPHLMHNVLVSELLYSTRKLIAAEALRLGMVTKVLWPDKFHKELISIVKTISNHSMQFMQTTKKQLRHHIVENVDVTLTQEVDILIQHWTSAECQKNFSVYG